MSMHLKDLNALDSGSFRQHMLRCCGSQTWADRMVERRPYTTWEQLQEAGKEIWFKLAERDWLEAFAHHPQIGGKASGWAANEQKGMQGAAGDMREELARLNGAYYEKFGFVFLICATGKTAEEMLASLRKRVGNSRDVELTTAVEEQAKITALRLEKL